MIEIKGVSKRFKNETAIDYDDVVFDSGKSYMLLGASGCGKSTLLNIIAGVLAPTSGRVIIDGADMTAKSQKEKVYYVTSDKPFTEADKNTMLKGIVIEGKNTAPAKLSLIEGQPENAYVTLTEGKFHEVKRLCYACGEKEVLELKRTEFCGLKLDESLAEGEWRNLTSDEVEILMKQ